MRILCLPMVMFMDYRPLKSFANQFPCSVSLAFTLYHAPNFVDHLVTKLNMYDPFPRILWEMLPFPENESCRGPHGNHGFILALWEPLPLFRRKTGLPTGVD